MTKRWERWVAQALMAGAFGIGLFALALAVVLGALAFSQGVLSPLMDRWGIETCIFGPTFTFIFLWAGWFLAGRFLKKMGVWEKDDPES